MIKKSIFTFSLICFSLLGHAKSVIEFTEKSAKSDATKIVFVSDAAVLTGKAKEIDDSTNGRLTKLLAMNHFTGAFGQTQMLQMVGSHPSVLVVGINDSNGIDEVELQNLGGIIASSLESTKKSINASIYSKAIPNKYASAFLAYGYHLRDYSFDKYKSDKNKGQSSLEFVTSAARDNEAKYNNDLSFIAKGVHYARDFATEPGKNMYPEAFAQSIKQKFKGIKNVDVEILDLKDIEKLNMGALAGVGKGSVHEPRLVVIEYAGLDDKQAPIALAGKGITFDTGGISLKKNDGMWAMKSDLSGAAAVAGAMYAIASRQEKANVVGLMALAENMPSAVAIRPGDVLETMQGTTIEIMSTDAEGRLVLSDAVYYAQREYEPKLLLNIATLTGSAARALSDEYAALITRDFKFSVEVMDIGARSGEHVWPLPLHANHFEQIKSPIADIKNSGAGSPGASIGAAVIGTFVDEDLPWIHLDIAGVDWLQEDIDIAPKGSQGWGVRFMDTLVREYGTK